MENDQMKPLESRTVAAAYLALLAEREMKMNTVLVVQAVRR